MKPSSRLGWIFCWIFSRRIRQQSMSASNAAKNNATNICTCQISGNRRRCVANETEVISRNDPFWFHSVTKNSFRHLHHIFPPLSSRPPRKALSKELTFRPQKCRQNEKETTCRGVTLYGIGRRFAYFARSACPSASSRYAVFLTMKSVICPLLTTSCDAKINLTAERSAGDSGSRVPMYAWRSTSSKSVSFWDRPTWCTKDDTDPVHKVGVANVHLSEERRATLVDVAQGDRGKEDVFKWTPANRDVVHFARFSVWRHQALLGQDKYRNSWTCFAVE